MSRKQDDDRDTRPPASSPCAMHEVDPEYMGLAPNAVSTPDTGSRALPDLGRALLDALPDAIIYADKEGTIRFWNHGAERIFGFTAAEATGQSLDIIIPQPLRSRHWEGYHRMMKTGESRHGADELLAVPARNRADEKLSIQFTVAPVPGPGGTAAGIIAVLRDVTDTFNEMKRLRGKRA